MRFSVFISVTTVIFYLVFYAVLIAFFFIMMSIFVYVVMDANYPTVYGPQTPLQHNPGLSLRPQPDLKTTLVRFIQGDPSSYKVHLDHIQTFLERKFYLGGGFILKYYYIYGYPLLCNR